MHFRTLILTDTCCYQQPSFLALNCLAINKQRSLGYYRYCYNYQHFFFQC